MKIFYFLSFVLLISLFTSCEKDNCKNCYPTVFECKVDGKTWKTSCESKDNFGCTALDAQLYSNSLHIQASNDSKDQFIELVLFDNEIKIGNYKLYSGSSVFSAFYNDKNSATCGGYIVDTLIKNNLNITSLDTVNQILQGTFEFTGKNNCGDEVKITNGKIDVIYRN